MKLVTFGRAMAPHGIGDSRLVEDAVAARLDSEGALSASVTWPAEDVSVPTARPPHRPIIKTRRPGGFAGRAGEY